LSTWQWIRRLEPPAAQFARRDLESIGTGELLSDAPVHHPQVVAFDGRQASAALRPAPYQAQRYPVLFGIGESVVQFHLELI
jgi:hypothetical protein